MRKPWLSNRLYVPEEYVSESILDSFRYSFTRFEDERVEDERGRLIEIKKIFYKEEHETFKYRNGVYGFHRGDLRKLRTFFGNLPWKDKRAEVPMGAPLRHRDGFEYRHDQEKAIEKMENSLGGGLQIAPTGWGKTIFGISMAIRLGQRTLVLASQVNWLEDWMKDLRKHTNVNELEEELGYPVAGIIKNKVKEENLFPCINFCTFQAFFSEKGRKSRARLRDCFGLVIADEASKLPAPETGASFTAFNPRWRIALSADEKRPDNLHRLTYDYVGPVIGRGRRKDTVKAVVLREHSGMDIAANYLYGRMWIGPLQSRICKNTGFTKLIAQRAIEDVEDGYKVMIVTKTRKQVATLAGILEEEEYMVRQKSKKTGKTRTVYRTPVVVQMMGSDPQMDEKKKRARAGEIDILVCTPVVQMNTDIDRMDCLHDVMPVNNDQTIRQRSGRVTRSHPDKKTPRIRIWDFSAYPPSHPAASFLRNQWTRREQWYTRQGFEIMDITEDGIVKFMANSSSPSQAKSKKKSWINRKG